MNFQDFLNAIELMLQYFGDAKYDENEEYYICKTTKNNISHAIIIKFLKQNTICQINVMTRNNILNIDSYNSADIIYRFNMHFVNYIKSIVESLIKTNLEEIQSIH